MLKISQRGIAPLLVVIIVAIVVGVSSVAVSKLQKPKQNSIPQNNQIASTSATISATASASPIHKILLKSALPSKTSPTSTPSSTARPATSSSPTSSTNTPTSSTQQAQGTISVYSGTCISGNVVSIRMDYTITGQVNGSLWGSVKDEKSGEKIIFLYIKGVASGPGGGTFGNEIGSIRRAGSMPVAGDGRTYTFRLFVAPDTTDLPTTDGTTIASTTFSKTCSPLPTTIPTPAAAPTPDPSPTPIPSPSV